MEYSLSDLRVCIAERLMARTYEKWEQGKNLSRSDMILFYIGKALIDQEYFSWSQALATTQRKKRISSAMSMLDRL